MLTHLKTPHLTPAPLRLIFFSSVGPFNTLDLVITFLLRPIYQSEVQLLFSALASVGSARTAKLDDQSP